MTFEPEFDPASVAELDEIFKSVDTAETLVIPSLLSTEDLLTQFYELTSALSSRNEVRTPRTDKGRELHSLRAAVRIEMLKRRLI